MAAANFCDVNDPPRSNGLLTGGLPSGVCAQCQLNLTQGTAVALAGIVLD